MNSFENYFMDFELIYVHLELNIYFNFFVADGAVFSAGYIELKCITIEQCTGFI